MPIFKSFNKGRVPVRVWTDDIAPDAINQLINVASLPIVSQHIAAMPDVHLGKGATVGSVIPTKNAVIPAAVGVDIGCGMNAMRLSLKAHQLPDNLAAIRSSIEAAVPIGVYQHKWRNVHSSVIAKNARVLDDRLDRLVAKYPVLLKMQKQLGRTWLCQLGTLGSGNHFIELCLDKDKNVWIMLHSGSRGIGNTIGRYFINAARKDMERHQVRLPDKDLAYLCEGSELFDDYMFAVEWAQDYALLNRREMMRLVVDALKVHVPEFMFASEAISCHHNYIARETHFDEQLYITRKGAIAAGAGQLGIVPGSMGAKSYIVRGLGNVQSFNSCAHGAGRKMSRSAAKAYFSRDDLIAQTAGIECRKDQYVVDEIPGAYKDIDMVMENQTDLVEVVHTLRQVLCIKG